MPVHFFEEEAEFKLKNPLEIIKWVMGVISEENRVLIELNFIFCSDHYLHKINKEYLNHDTFTDIITFDNSEKAEQIEGDIFISIERVKDNADKIGVAFITELKRVIVHGVLHLVGYNDKTKEQIIIMRKKEEAYLSLQLKSE